MHTRRESRTDWDRKAQCALQKTCKAHVKRFSALKHCFTDFVKHRAQFSDFFAILTPFFSFENVLLSQVAAIIVGHT